MALIREEVVRDMDLFQRTVLGNPFIPYRPTPKQADFLARFDREVFYGGSAGGGKSISLLMAALQFVEYPRYSALLLRKTFRDLMQPGALIPVAKEWLKDKAKWNSQEKRWYFPSGATLTFGYLAAPDDIYQYQGAAFDFTGFDEASQFDEYQYRYLFSRLRKPIDSEVPIRMRATSNPGGRGHEWCKHRFIDPDSGRVFIRAKLDDNPHLNRVEYVQSLSELDPITRKQLLAGDWDAFEGGRFAAHWFGQFHAARDDEGQMRYFLEGREATGVHVSRCWNFVCVDPAASTKESADYTVIGAFAVTPQRDLLVLEIVRDHFAVDTITDEIAKVCADYSPDWVGIEAVAFQEQIVREAQKHPGIPSVRRLMPMGKDKLVRATPAINRAKEGQIFVPERSRKHPWVEEFLGELVSFTGDPEQDAYCDQVDCLAYGVLSLDQLGITGPLIITPDEEDDGGDDDDLQQGGGGGSGMGFRGGRGGLWGRPGGDE